MLDETDYEEPPHSGIPQLCRALYDYAIMQPDDLAIATDEVILLLVTRDDGWSLGLNAGGAIGYIPQLSY